MRGSSCRTGHSHAVRRSGRSRPEPRRNHRRDTVDVLRRYRHQVGPSLAPETVNSFLFLASEGYFDGTVFHRVIPGFVAQGGDPTATGTGGPGYAVPDEFPHLRCAYDRGVLAMANAGPGTTGSQFFIMLADGGLPPQYSIFGWVTEGLEILDLLQEVPLGQSPTSPDPTPSTPLETIYINSVTVEN